MRPSRCVLPKALVLAIVAGCLAAGTAFAQYYDPALRSLDLGSDVPRSPRLLGMGSLSITVPDRNQRFTLWDFAGNPVGAYGDDSTSTLEMRPGSGSAAGAHDGLTGKEREDLAGRASVMDFETFHRDEEGSAWGAVGTLRSLRADNLYDFESESRRTITDPQIMPILTGPFPYWGQGKLHFALRAQFAHTDQQDQRLAIVTTQGGEFISFNGFKLTPPDLFTPTEYIVRRTGLGLWVSYPAGRSATLSVGYDLVGDRIHGTNDGIKSASETKETRPYRIAQATMIGRLGSSLEYAADERHWSARSQQDWTFSASAGVGAFPLVGAGTAFQREERGNSFNGAIRWSQGNMRVAGQYWTYMSRADYTPPVTGDPSSFNTFLWSVYNRPGADSLALPDSIVSDRVQSNAVGYVGGVSWKLKRGVVGVEYHWARDIATQTVAGAGPKAVAYDVRAGLERQCSAIVTGRLGGSLLWRDRDEFTHGNKWRGESASAGLGLTPPRARWMIDLGWTMTWLQPQFEDPLVHRTSDEKLQALVHWSF